MMKRWNIAVYVALIFLSGIAVGAFGHRLYTVNTVSAKVVRSSPEEFRKRYIAEMESRLKLRSDQVTQLNVFLDQTRAKLHEVHERNRPEMEAIRHDQNNKIREMLDDRQRLEYEQILREREQNQKKGAGAGF